MFIDIEDGVVETSEGDFIKQEDISKVKYEESSVRSVDYIPYTLEKVETKVFFEIDSFEMMSRSSRENGYSYDLTPEIQGLSITEDDYNKIQKLIHEEKKSTTFFKSATYTLYNKDMVVIGTHTYSKEYDDKLYLMAQWKISQKDIKDLCKTILTTQRIKTKVK